jgi:uncharacterized protein
MITSSEKNIIKNALKGIDYEKIILFGSRARGDQRQDSDFDLMIIIKNDLSREEKMKLFSLINNHLIKEGIDSDILIRSNNQIEYFKNKAGSVTNEAVREGFII